MSPRLRDFRMPIEKPVIILNSLQIFAPNISHLVLSCMTVDDRCISVLCSLSQLQEITLKDNGRGTTPIFDLSFFPRLSCKEVLQEFTLDGEIIWSAGSLDCGTVGFPLLKYINFRVCFTMGPIAKLFHYAMVPSLERITIRFGPSPSKLVKAVEAPYWHQFFDRIGRATSNHFKTLEIMLDDFCPPGRTREQWEHVGLRVSNFPNFNIPSLEALTITLPFLRSLNRIDLQKIINSCSSLSRLDVTSFQPSELDFTALLDIADGLPRLELLCIPLDIRGPLSLEGIPLLAHNLQSIDLDIFPSKDVGILVQCIDRIFPYLKRCSFYHVDDLIDDASSLLNMLQNARRDELGRATLGITGV